MIIRRCIPCVAMVAGAALAMLTSSSNSVAAPPRHLSPVQANPVRAKSVQQAHSPVQSARSGECCADDDCCDQCGRGRNRDRRGARAGNFSCGCNGSYKFPVPPLSTYHWPGMYSIQLMTDYQSPWRFPPLKPYTDEPPYNGDALMTSSSGVANVSFVKEQKSVRHGGIEPMSAKIQRLYGNK